MFGYTQRGTTGQAGRDVDSPNGFATAIPHIAPAISPRPHGIMGAGRELFDLHKTGTEFPVELGLNPIDPLPAS